MTTFVVLSRKGDNGYLPLDGTTDAHSMPAAVTTAYMKMSHDERSGVTEMAAVPARSWNPTRVSVQVSEKIVLGGDPGLLDKVAGEIEAQTK